MLYDLGAENGPRQVGTRPWLKMDAAMETFTMNIYLAICLFEVSVNVLHFGV